MADADDLGGVFVRAGLLAGGPIDHFLGFGDGHDGRLFLVLDERHPFELAFLAAHDLGKDGWLGAFVAQFVLLDEVALVDRFHVMHSRGQRHAFYYA
ncbi:MAG: hypothetical protein V4484_03765 [Pseudomonadota bacterium]